MVDIAAGISPRERTRLSLGETLLVVAAMYFIALKLVFSVGAGPIADENVP